jgi:ATP-dependent Clp protease ATP-binding subunit ClpA
MHRALAHANQRKHQYATLEHLLLALIDDLDASATMRACKIDLGVLKEKLIGYLDNELERLVIFDDSGSRPTAAFQRVVQRAVLHVQVSGRHIVTGGQLLMAMFSETESPTARLLGEQGMTRQDAASFIAHGTVKGSGGAARGLSTD